MFVTIFKGYTSETFPCHSFREERTEDGDLELRFYPVGRSEFVLPNPDGVSVYLMNNKGETIDTKNYKSEN